MSLRKEKPKRFKTEPVIRGSNSNEGKKFKIEKKKKVIEGVEGWEYQPPDDDWSCGYRLIKNSLLGMRRLGEGEDFKSIFDDINDQREARGEERMKKGNWLDSSDLNSYFYKRGFKTDIKIDSPPSDDFDEIEDSLSSGDFSLIYTTVGRHYRGIMPKPNCSNKFYLLDSFEKGPQVINMNEALSLTRSSLGYDAATGRQERVGIVREKSDDDNIWDLFISYVRQGKNNNEEKVKIEIKDFIRFHGSTLDEISEMTPTKEFYEKAMHNAISSVKDGRSKEALLAILFMSNLGGFLEEGSLYEHEDGGDAGADKFLDDDFLPLRKAMIEKREEMGTGASEDKFFKKLFELVTRVELESFEDDDKERLIKKTENEREGQRESETMDEYFSEVEKKIMSLIIETGKKELKRIKSYSRMDADENLRRFIFFKFRVPALVDKWIALGKNRGHDVFGSEGERELTIEMICDILGEEQNS